MISLMSRPAMPRCRHCGSVKTFTIVPCRPSPMVDTLTGRVRIGCTWIPAPPTIVFGLSVEVADQPMYLPLSFHCSNYGRDLMHRITNASPETSHISQNNL